MMLKWCPRNRVQNTNLRFLPAGACGEPFDGAKTACSLAFSLPFSLFQNAIVPS